MRHGKKEKQEDINKIIGIVYFHYVPSLFPLLLEKEGDPRISGKKAQAWGGVDACPGGKEILKELSMRG